MNFVVFGTVIKIPTRIEPVISGACLGIFKQVFNRFRLLCRNVKVLVFLIGSFPLPWYKAVPMSLALSPRIYKEVKDFKPDIIHASSPGIMVSVAWILVNDVNMTSSCSYIFIH